MPKVVCKSLQSTYSPHFLPIESFYFWSMYDVFEQQRLILDFGCAGSTIFALGSSYVPLCPCKPKWDRNNLSNSVDLNQTAHTEGYDKGLHCLTGFVENSVNIKKIKFIVRNVHYRTSRYMNKINTD